MGEQGFFTIKQLATRFDLEEKEIEMYIAAGLLEPLHLNDGILFRSSDFLRLEVLEKGALLGITIHEMRLILSSVRRGKR